MVHRHEPVGVAVEGEAEIRAFLHDGLGRASGCVEPHASLIFEPSGSPAITLDARPETFENAGGHLTARAVRAVDRRCFSPSRAPVEPTIVHEVVGVLLDALGITREAARPRGRPALGDRRPGRRGSATSSSSIVGLHRVGELQPAGCEELHAVVGERVVRGRHHGGGNRAPLGEPRHAGRRKDPEVDDVRRPRSPSRQRAPPGASAPTCACRGRSGSASAGSTLAAARPSARTTSGLSSALATPRIPSVPNRAPLSALGLQRSEHESRF